ncbi:hypothetical protein IB229_20650 [Pseudomonas sp. PDM14]|uniref:hypothetical protein n=1 Tax=Pseudomonas sp. PDM14 TaxID=2769288 RepID=UPI00177FEC66|nr:hypothetical protein [Pseudomonas sp. PDM14]MBD9485396.1 hypothetical protein [Pseudomonas sp. PDM14]
MGVHEWARQEIERSLQQAQQQGHAPLMSLRALLSVVVQRQLEVRSVDDLAAELLFLADNLDDERDYSFMRP